MTTTYATGLDEVFDRPPDPSVALLTLRDVSVSFGGLAALSGVSLDIGPRDLVAVVGPNGAGKSTTLNAICQLVRSSGDITLKGQPINGTAAWRVAARGIGRSFQDPPLIDRYTVLENILCGAHLRLGYRMADQIFRRRHVRQHETVMARRAEILLDFVDLAGYRLDEAGSLPYGARKLVDIARAMVAGPQILLLDEPSSGLDHHERSALQRMLCTLRDEQRVAILVVEHHMDLVRATATHVAAMQAGEVLMTGTPAEVLDSDRFRSAVVGHAGDGDPDADGADTLAVREDR
jgi:branched-chain amino acid transport system ATP-binding protein